MDAAIQQSSDTSANRQRNKGMRPLRRLNSFAILLLSSILLTFGNKIYELVLPLLMYELTHSSVAMAQMRTAELLPNFFFAVFIGVIVDRVNKKTWVISMVGAQAVLLIALVLLVRSGSPYFFLYYLIGFLLMTFNYGYFNAQMSLTKLAVPGQQLTQANAKFSLVDTFFGVMGPALSGLILMLAHLYDGLLMTAAAYLICVLLLFQLRLNQGQDARVTHGTMWEDLREGWKAFRANRLMGTMTLFIMGLNCTMTVVGTTLIFYAKDDLHLSDSLLALVLSVSGVGGLAASLFVGRLRTKFGIGVLFGCSALVNGLSYLGMFASSNVYMLLPALLANGFAMTVYAVCANTFRHEQTPVHLIGRISGITGMLYRVGMPVAMMISGYMIQDLGASSVFIASAAFNLVLFALLLRTALWRTR
ncbi:MFS transporter [Paenibacillus gansuensis]|uniref:MFS transporter n=1 Tax=Paenibacillus gansuensis TaxID=306542 RepID=A0ABW5PK29_9BACL